jgi:hypothetical protein
MAANAGLAGCLNSSSHELHDVAIDASSNVVWRIMLDVFSFTELACPPAVSELSGCVSVKER